MVTIIVASPNRPSQSRKRSSKSGKSNSGKTTLTHFPVCIRWAAGYVKASKFDRALPLLEETLRLQREKLGPDHPDTFASMHTLAVGYANSRELAKAVPIYEMLCKLRNDKLGPNHPDTLSSMASLGVVYAETGQSERALPLLKKILPSRMRDARSGRPEHAKCAYILAKTYCDLKQGKKAASLLIEYINGWRRQYPKDDPQFSELLAHISMDLLLPCDQFATAESMLRECLAIREAVNPDLWSTFDTQSILGGTLLSQKKHADAESHLLKGFEGMKARERTIPTEWRTRTSRSSRSAYRPVHRHRQARRGEEIQGPPRPVPSCREARPERETP